MAVVGSLLATVLVTALSTDQVSAALYNPIPLNAAEEPNYNFVDDDALFVFVTSDIAGGKVCVVPADGGGCVWGTTTLVGIGSVFAPMEGPSLPVGRWRIRAENTAGEETGLSEVFSVRACATCSREFALARLQEWKNRALSMKVGLGLTCVALNVKDAAGQVSAARGKIKKATDRADAYQAGTSGFAATIIPLGGMSIAFPPTSPLQFNQNKAMEILKDLSCAAGAMYYDIYNDPPDPNFSTVIEPTFAAIGDSDRDSMDSLMTALDRQTAFGEVALSSYERYLGAVAAGDNAAAARQAQAASAYSFQQVLEMRASSTALRAYASDLAAQAPFNGPLATPENWALIEAAHERVATEGFSPAELAQLEGAGLTASQIADIRTHFEIDRTGFDPSRSLVSYLRALADATDAAIDDFDAFAREASAIAGRRALDIPNQAPTAAFTATPGSGEAPLDVTFTSSSSDPDGTIVQYRWNYGDGVIGTGNADVVEHTYSIPGTYTVTLTVTDDDGATNSTSRTVVATGPAANTPPVAQPQSVTTSMNTPIQITLSGTDADGDPLSYAISNPPSGSLSGTGAVRTYTPPTNQVGTDVFSFTVNDGEATSAPATVTINIQQPTSTNTPPVAQPQSVSTTMNTSVPITLSGTDADGDPLTYAIVTNPRGTLTGSGATRTYRPPTGQVGTDSFAFTVRDGEATSAPAVVSIVIGEPPVVNLPPVITSTTASITSPEGNTVNPQRTVTDPDGIIVSQTWSTSEGYSGTALARFSDNGTYTLTLTAVDNWGASTSYTWPVTVTNSPPVIGGSVAGRWRSGVPRPMAVTVSDAGVNDGPFVVTWDFGDGATATGAEVSHTWAANGTYTVRVTATDKDGGTRTNTYQVQVRDLVVEAGPPVTGPDGQRLTFDFTGSSPRDATISYVVDWGDGTAPQTLSSLNGFHTYSSPGNYLVTLTGTDAIPGAPTITLSDTTTVAVNRPPVALLDTQSTPLDTATLVYVLDNDSDPNGDAITITNYSQPAHGSVTCAPAGPCTYTPDTGHTGADQFTYEITDARGGTDSATVVLVVGIDVQLPADVVFAIDESGSMSSAFNQLKANVATISTQLFAAGLDARLGLVGYGSGGGHGSYPATRPHIHTPLTDIGRFQQSLNELLANGGIEPAREAVVTATSDGMNFRAGAGVCVVLITDEPTNGDQVTQDQAQAALEARDATLFAIGPAGQPDPTAGLVAASGGAAFPISGAAGFLANPTQVLTALLERCVGSIVEGINLSPLSATANVGSSHTVTAVVRDSAANPVVGATVRFEVTDGPHTGRTQTVVTGSDGQAAFTYSGTDTGADSITASFVDSQTQETRSAFAAVSWEPRPGGPLSAVDDVVSTDEDTAVVVDVLGNDSHLNGDELSVTLVVGPANGVATLVDGGVRYVPAANFHGTDSFSYSVSDGVASSTATVTVTVVPVNDPPTVTLPTLAPREEGSTWSVAASASDVDGDVLNYAWTVVSGAGVDAGGDCVVSGTGAIVDIACNDDGTFEVRVEVSDPDGASDTATASVVVTNVAPDVSIVAPLGDQYDVGATVTVAASFLDPGANDTHTCSIDWGEGAVVGGTVSAGQCTSSHSYSTAGLKTVTVTVTDDDDGIGLAATSALIVQPNRPPAVTLPTLAPREEGSTWSITASATDADGDALTYAWTAVPGADVDAGGDCVVSGTGATVDITCDDDGTFEVSVEVSDPDGASSATATALTVINVAPIVKISSPTSLRTVDAGDFIELRALFDDAGANDTHTCSIDWGDGASTTGTIATGECVGTHTYVGTVTPTITVTVADDDGGLGSDALTATPPPTNTLGKVTGGGWTHVSGDKVSFGLVAISVRGSMRGQLQLQIPGARFHGTTVTEFKALGSTATWSGSGRFHRGGAGSFTITVVDRGTGKHKPPDAIHIELFDAAGVRVWTGGGSLKGGNLVVHPPPTRAHR